MPKYKPLYLRSFREASALGQRSMWRESFNENCECAKAIELAISDNYHNDHLEECAEGIIERFGTERVDFVLAVTLQDKDWDGRFSPSNKAWAQEFDIPPDDGRHRFVVQSHPGLVDIFLDQVRRSEQDMERSENSSIELGGI